MTDKAADWIEKELLPWLEKDDCVLGMDVIKLIEHYRDKWQSKPDAPISIPHGAYPKPVGMPNVYSTPDAPETLITSSGTVFTPEQYQIYLEWQRALALERKATQQEPDKPIEPIHLNDFYENPQVIIDTVNVCVALINKREGGGE